jgi:hypothetical protein
MPVGTRGAYPPVRRFSRLEDAKAALDRILNLPDRHPEEHFGIVTFDAEGRQVGEPLVHASSTALLLSPRNARPGE